MNKHDTLLNDSFPYSFKPAISDGETKHTPCAESKAKRTRAGKIFHHGHNLYQAVMFADPVHYKDRASGQWEEIDNTLIPVADSSGNVFLTNRANDELKVEFHPSTDVAMVVLQDEQEHLLAWYMEDASEVKPIQANKPYNVHKDCDPLQTALEHLDAEAVYPNIFPDTDLHCCIQSMSFKDEIIFANPEAVRPVSFALSMPNLVPVQQEDASINLIEPEGDGVFTLPKPFVKRE